MPKPAELDESLDEFWSGNAFSISLRHNLSGYERNRTYLNANGKNFVDVSFLSGTDSDGDGRCVVPIDFNLDGQRDLIVRQTGGAPSSCSKTNSPSKTGYGSACAASKATALASAPALWPKLVTAKSSANSGP